MLCCVVLCVCESKCEMMQHLENLLCDCYFYYYNDAHNVDLPCYYSYYNYYNDAAP